jgi:hypothetical protein
LLIEMARISRVKTALRAFCPTMTSATLVKP